MSTPEPNTATNTETDAFRDSLAFEQVSSETAFQGHRVHVDVNEYRYPDGRQVTREIVQMNNAVVVVAFDKDGVWMIQQPREAVGEHMLTELPAGVIDDGEEPAVAAQRELAEETGLRARHWLPSHVFYPTPGCVNETLHLFIATGLSAGERHLDDDERILVRQHSLDNLDELIRTSRDGKTLLGLMELRHLLAGADRMTAALHETLPADTVQALTQLA